MPDIILITIDSLRRDHLSCYGYDRQTTPNIDKLANESVVFDNAFAHAGSTRFSFPSILSSIYAPIYNSTDDINNRTLISEILSSQEYSTGGFHSNPFLNYGYSDGFDQFLDPKDNPSTSSRLRQYIQRNIPHDSFVYKSIKSIHDLAESVIGEEIGSAYVDAKQMTDLALDWLNSTQESNRFLWVHYMDPHHPYTPPNAFQEHFSNYTVSKEESLRLRRKMLDTPQKVTEDELGKIIDLYDAEIRYVDHHIGRLTESIMSTSDDSTVVVASDHGEEFQEHGQFSHGTYHEECIRVPLIIKYGKNQTAECRSELVGLIDIPPTIAGAANIEPPGHYMGEDLMQGEVGREQILGGWEESDNSVTFCRTKEYKGVIHNGKQYLFDVKSGSEIELDEEIPSNIEQGLSLFKSYKKGQVESSESMDENTKNRLKDLGYLQ